MSTTFAHLIRAEGFSKQASFGMTMGAVLNIVLDPIFISVIDMKIEGAALATMLSNLVALGYFLLHVYRRKDTQPFEPEACIR